MTRLDKIEQDIASLSRDELADFRAWFETFDAARFDRRIEEDARSGRLDGVADTALTEFRAGRTRRL